MLIFFLLLYIYSFFFAQISQMADDTGLDFSDQINALEGKYQQVPDIGD